jgi:hypothetical protein
MEKIDGYEIKFIKILLYTDYIGKINFPRWERIEIPNSLTPIDDDLDDDLEDGTMNPFSKEEKIIGIPFIIKIQELQMQLLKIGEKVMGLGINQMRLFLENLNHTHPNLIPKQNSIKQIVNECNQTFTTTDFLNIYQSSSSSSLSSSLQQFNLNEELVSPTQSKLKII